MPELMNATAAPWVLQFDGYDNSYVLNSDGGVIYLSLGGASEDTLRENLQLIRGARDLYDALRLCERALELRDTEAEEHAAKTARAVLAKVEAPLDV